MLKVKVSLIASWYKPSCDGCDELTVYTLSHGVGAVCELIEADKPCKVNKGERNG